MPLQKLIGNIYSVFIEIILWLIPVIGITIGIILTKELDLFYGDTFIGFILGLLAGLLLDVICFGPMIIIMNIRSSLKNIENK
jgi:hypothetical protein